MKAQKMKDTDIRIDTIVCAKTDELVQSIVSLSNTLPDSELYDLRTRLKNSVTSVLPNLEEGFRNNQRVERIRHWIRATSHLEECRDYLNLVESLRYGKTSHLLDKINEISDLLKQDYSAIKVL
jgi:four helix bundle protein